MSSLLFVAVHLRLLGACSNYLGEVRELTECQVNYLLVEHAGI